MKLSPDDVEHALNLLGIVVERVDGDEVYAHCPGHQARLGRPDRSASWSVNAEKLSHYCFSCGYSGSLIGLVCETNGWVNSWGMPNYEEAKRWLQDQVGLDISDVAQRLEELKESYLRLPPPVEMSEARLAVYGDVPDWALSERGVSREAVDQYKVRWDVDRDVWILPLRHAVTGKLIGWQEKGQRLRYFNNRPTNLKKSKTIFGWSEYQGGPAVVVESPLDAVRITSMGMVHGLATCGVEISEAQFQLLRHVDKLIFAMDNPYVDDAGRAASRKILEKTKDKYFECWFFHYPKDKTVKDPGDMTDAEIFHAVNSARHCLHGDKAFLY